MNKYSKLFTFIQVLIFALLTAFIVGSILDRDWYKGIFVGVFILIFYYSNTALEEIFKDNTSQKKESFFKPKLFAILGFALGILGMTTLITNIIFSYAVNYCKKDGLFYSEMRCAIQNAEHSIRDKYGDAYDDYDYDY